MASRHSSRQPIIFPHHPRPLAQPMAVVGIILLCTAPAAAQQDAGHGVRLGTVRVLDSRPEENNYTVPESSAATGMDLSLRETPQSVSVMTSRQMREQNLTSVRDVLKNSPGVSAQSAAPGDPSGTYYYARGFLTNGLQVDGNQRESSYDLDSIGSSAVYETASIVRGAAGLMGDTGDPGATLSLTRKRPTAQPQVSLEGGIGSWDHYQATLDAAGPLDADGKLRGRLVLTADRGGAWIDRTHWQSSTLYGILEYDLGPDTVFSAGIQHDHEKTTDSGFPPYSYYGDDEDGYTALSSSRRHNFSANWTHGKRQRSEIFTGVEHHLANGWKAQAQYSHSIGKNLDIYDNAAEVYADGSSLYNANRTDDKSHGDNVHLKLSGDYALLGKKHEFSAGISYSNHDNFGNPQFDTPEYTIEDIFTFDGNVEQPEFTNLGHGGEKTKRSSVHASTRLHATERWAVIAGGRLSRWEGSEQTPNTATQLQHLAKTHFNPFIGTTYDLDRGVSLYASYSGIFNPGLYLDEDGNLLEPETGTTTELGVKGEWLEGRLNASVAVFQSRKDNVAVSVDQLPDGSYYYRSEDDTKGNGWELTLAGEPLPGWRISAAYSHSAPKDKDGERLDTTIPVQQFQLASSYDVNEQWTLGGDLAWQSRTWQWDDEDAAYQNEVVRAATTQRAYALLNLTANYRPSKEMSVGLHINNLLDKTYRTLPLYEAHGAPRSVMATLRYEFL